MTVESSNDDILQNYEESLHQGSFENYEAAIRILRRQLLTKLKEYSFWEKRILQHMNTPEYRTSRVASTFKHLTDSSHACLVTAKELITSQRLLIKELSGKLEIDEDLDGEVIGGVEEES